jgi:transposase
VYGRAALIRVCSGATSISPRRVACYFPSTSNYFSTAPCCSSIASPSLTLRPCRKYQLELTRFRGHFSMLAEREVHDVPQSRCIPTGIPAEADRAGRSRRSPEELSKEFEPSAQTIRNWVKRAEADGGKRRDVLTSLEREELVKLRRENRQLKTEREILAKATAWFAREADTKPKKSSGS